MSRVQLALTVSDVDVAVEFYSRLLGAPPATRRPGYANFALADPPMTLVLLEAAGADGAGTLNHLGIEVDTPAAVSAAGDRLRAQGLHPVAEHGATCCYAVQDKVWVSDPDGAPWEIYTVLADAPRDPDGHTGACCAGGGCVPAELAGPAAARTPAGASRSVRCC